MNKTKLYQVLSADITQNLWGMFTCPMDHPCGCLATVLSQSSVGGQWGGKLALFREVIKLGLDDSFFHIVIQQAFREHLLCPALSYSKVYQDEHSSAHA